MDVGRCFRWLLGWAVVTVVAVWTVDRLPDTAGWLDAVVMCALLAKLCAFVIQEFNRSSQGPEVPASDGQAESWGGWSEPPC